MNDPKNIGIPNISFSIYSDGDKREDQFLKERIERGFDESETWSLDSTIASFIIPRIKAFIEVNPGHPGNIESDQWDEILNKILLAFELTVKDNTGGVILTGEDHMKIEEGMQLFAKWFRHLWW